MSLFTSDLYRNFGVGFAAGALVVAMNSGSAILDAVPNLIGSIL